MGFLKKLFWIWSAGSKFTIHPDDENLVTEYDRKWGNYFH